MHVSLQLVIAGVLLSLTHGWTLSPPKVINGITSKAKRVRDSLLSKERSREDLKIGIAGFYDRSSKLWEDVWGEVSVDMCDVLQVFCGPFANANGFELSCRHKTLTILPSHPIYSICTMDITYQKIEQIMYKLR